MLIQIVQAVSVMALFVLLALWLRKRKILGRDNLPGLTGLVTDVVFPLFLFAALAKASFTVENLFLPLILASSESVCLVLAWTVARFLRLSRARTGAFMLASAFGATSFLGLPIIQQVLSTQQGAMADAVVTVEFGTSFLLVTVGLGVAIHYGSCEVGQYSKSIKRFFTGPTFIALIAGLLWSVLKLPTDGFLAGLLFHLCDLAGNALPLLAGLCIGLMIEPVDWRDVLKLFIAACVIKLLIMPMIAASGGHYLQLKPVAIEVALILAAMPTATLSAIYSQRYGCDGKLASSLILGTLVVSLFTIPLSLRLWAGV